MEVKPYTSTSHENYIQKLPLEIISNIVKQLSIIDIISLTTVSKVWRSIFLNQNSIWKVVCQNLDLREEDYYHCHADIARSDANCKAYIETNSERYFGPFCKWWTIFNRYNMIIRNIKNNDFPIIHIPRKLVGQSFCTDDYIVNVNYFRSMPIEVLIFKNCDKPKKINLHIMDSMKNIFRRKQYKLQIIGNKKYLILEMHSILMVYKICNGNFIPSYTKTVRRSADNSSSDYPDASFMDKNSNTIIDLCDDFLALIQPKNNVIFHIDLTSGKICKELVYSSNECIVNCMKCADKRLMIGITIMDKNNASIKHYFTIVYFLEEGSEDISFKIPLYGRVTQFKVTNNYIGVENTGSQTPFISKKSKLVNLFWIECDTFSFDCTRQLIYYNINQSIFQYDLYKARSERFEVVQKIAIDAVSRKHPLSQINDRFLLVRSIVSRSYDIFDVKDRICVKSIQLLKGFKLVHVGKLTVVFASRNEFLVVKFG